VVGLPGQGGQGNDKIESRTLWRLGRENDCETLQRCVWLRACRSRDNTGKDDETCIEPQGLVRARMDGCEVDISGWTGL
jgi:hypothetical protein